MNSRIIPRFGPVSALLLTAALVAGPAAAATITLTLDDVAVGSCDETWNENGVTAWFTATTDGDLTPGFCLFIADADNFGLAGVYIYPGRLVVDISTVAGLETVEVDVYETHFAGSTRARLYRDGSQAYYAESYQEDLQTLVLQNQDADTLVVSAHEAYVFEIRLIGESIVTDDAVEFGAIKALYR